MRALALAGALLLLSCGASGDRSAPGLSGPLDGASGSGPSDGGAGSGSLDGGIGSGPADPCGGLALSKDGAQSVSFKNDAVQATGGTADGQGTLALFAVSAGSPGWGNVEFVSSTGSHLGYFNERGAYRFDPLGAGVASTACPPFAGGNCDVHGVGTDGGALGGAHVALGQPTGAFPPLGSQFLIVGPFQEWGTPPGAPPEARWLDVAANPVTKGSSPLASANAVVGAGTDGAGNSLVAFAGHANGEIEAQWFAPQARPLSGLFTLLAGFDSGPNTWIEVTPALGGGVLVSRVDADARAVDEHTRHLCLSRAGATRCSPAPDWMERFTDRRLRLVRGGRAWAAITVRRTSVDCADTVELLAQDGTSCGSVELRMASGTCDRLDLAIGLDGTVVQTNAPGLHMPNGDNGGWRWWPGMLR